MESGESLFGKKGIPDNIRKALDSGASDREVFDAIRASKTIAQVEEELTRPEIEGFVSFDTNLPDPQLTLTKRVFSAVKENPFVPAGIGLTIGAFCYGVAGFLNNRSVQQQTGMRLRVGFQAATVVMFGGGLFYQQSKRRKKMKSVEWPDETKL